MHALLARIVAALLLLSGTSGCRELALRESESPLKPTRMSDDSLVLDVFFIRCPMGDPRLNEALWAEVDEQQLPPGLRRRLAENGFRAGLVAGSLPPTLADLMELPGKPPPADESGEVRTVSLEDEPTVVRRHLQTPPGKRNEVVASALYESLPALRCCEGQLRGETFHQAQGIFGVRARPQSDGRVRLQLVPELHYGRPRQRWAGHQGVLRMETRRARQVYDDLAVDVPLLPGDMLVFSSLPSRPGSLGHYFLTAGRGELQQKLLVVRLSQTQHDGVIRVPEGGVGGDQVTR
ncbi:MAG: hypothetical protein ACOC46_04060 [Pirellulales bacterium]